jgi:hypothetical protein
MCDPVSVAIAALCEAGYPELAETVEPNRVGRPMSAWFLHYEPTRERGLVMLRAARLAHLACPPGCVHYADCAPETLTEAEVLEVLLPVWRAMAGVVA